MQWPEHKLFHGMGQSRSLDIFICMVKVREPLVMKSSFLLIFPLAEAKKEVLILETE